MHDASGTSFRRSDVTIHRLEVDVKIGVMGAGAIGTYVGGRLVASGVPTVLVGRPALADEIARHGLHLTDYRGADIRVPAGAVQVATSPDAIADCDVVLLTVKSGDTAATGALLAGLLRKDA